jgi:hypothetical protein
MVASSAVAGALLWLGLGPAQILALLTLSGLPVAFAIARYAPDSPLGRLALSVWPRKRP